ncbi:MAG: hypothetical protein KGH61_00825 [Candidatus Micrarchaeota archaeon]|nr:hypothetical protein [Candidatus Micrarchaeota archaeon]MDE1847479.1 hypothetical protein [Candidatus Micrarchaeota archaeon]MDE1864026.1 hypothetical protein [Candidatus Micrarchaeota archaeon]
MDFAAPGKKDSNSKIKNFNGAAFADAIRSGAEVKDMQVGRVGYIPPSAIISTKDGELYINGRFSLSDNAVVAMIEIKRVSEGAFELNFLKMNKEDYKSILNFSNIEEASRWFFEVEPKDFISVGNIKTSTVPDSVDRDQSGISQ